MHKVDAFVDIRNQVCSKPVLEVRKRLELLEIGQVLEVLADSEGKENVLRIFGKIRKQNILDVVEKEGHLHIFIQKV
ncbi:MAG: sulfurtransferase TusA family protein [Methanomassiliicoccales archaeon]|nr:MAG: sulfurtransferase TusA family protein [Methanomassiliicoccales archaeon]